MSIEQPVHRPGQGDAVRRHMPKIRFEVEHLCKFLGSGTPFFNIEAVEAAFVDDLELLPWSTSQTGTLFSEVPTGLILS